MLNHPIAAHVEATGRIAGKREGDQPLTASLRGVVNRPVANQRDPRGSARRRLPRTDPHLELKLANPIPLVQAEAISSARAPTDEIRDERVRVRVARAAPQPLLEAQRERDHLLVNEHELGALSEFVELGGRERGPVRRISQALDRLRPIKIVAIPSPR